jgi:hypothetical protein
MRGIPLVVPFAWTKPGLFFLQAMRFGCEISSDCLPHRGFIR